MESTDHPAEQGSSVESAKQALRRGYQPIPIRSGGKRPHLPGWTHITHDEETVEEKFEEYAKDDGGNIGLLLGKPSGGLVDVDIDHPKASRLREYFLPTTGMRSGRAGRPFSHYWYEVTDNLPGTRQHKMPDGAVSVELRSTGAQTVIPPSIHPSGEVYRWEGGEWGEPAKIDGRVLTVQVALLGLGCVLLENWPKQGSRHEAYLALTGGLLRYGDSVHPWWEKNIRPLIRALAMVTNDEDGPDTREHEALQTTISRLRADGKAVGWPRLGEIIGIEHAEQARRLAREIEAAAGFTRTTDEPEVTYTIQPEEQKDGAEPVTMLPPEKRNPLDERLGGWDVVDLEPYLRGRIEVPEPALLRRSDGRSLFYPGRVNLIYGARESAKTIVALYACMQEMAVGGRVLYIDCEDEPGLTLERLMLMGAGIDDIEKQFFYIAADEPIGDMEVNAYGKSEATPLGKTNQSLLASHLSTIDPTVVIVDGITDLYNLHDLDSNQNKGIAKITTWLKRLTGNGRRTVVMIDHTPKSPGRSSDPIGGQHKMAAIQGTALHAWKRIQPIKGRLGIIELLVMKDRPARVRQFSTTATDRNPQIAGIVTIDSRDPSQMLISLDPADGAGDDGPVIDPWLDKTTTAGMLYDQIPRVFGGDLDLLLKISRGTGSEDGVTEKLKQVFGTDQPYESIKGALTKLIERDVIVKYPNGAHTKYGLKSP